MFVKTRQGEIVEAAFDHTAFKIEAYSEYHGTSESLDIGLYVIARLRTRYEIGHLIEHLKHMESKLPLSLNPDE